ncbi:DegT/DnrJ/EryC1/StrS aminotransferase family protein [uncultured Thioclava sp.]|jgi:dTDP-4-amino-4,6-dideoxygalactose transaminase|uniref:DegT/DnrJ/EryC1/StrS family aminotransferase n=1 Tax=uncultured Thioclava sp. TaxID=473858 RepID=UPI0025E6643B|nr:DegT/DnrJ/EryC1/StrS family aminotransferase [uncultured Thioclava sp.]
MIPFLNLRAQYRAIAPELEEAVLQVLRSGNYVLGEPVESFEENFALYCGAGSAIGVSSGTSALHLALLAAGIGPGDEVITTPSTFVATIAAILYTGATPVLVDIDPETWNMDPSGIKAAISPRTRAILPVHLHGRLADMEAIVAIARRHGLLVIEDAAQAHGAQRGTQRAGTFGDIGCFSFYPGKNLGACGEGGAIVTSSAELDEKVRCLRDWGQKGKGNHVVEGYNFRMDAVQGAILDVKLRHLDAWNAARRRIANMYHEGLAPDISRAKGPFGEDHVGHVYAIRVANRAEFQANLETASVPTSVHYPLPVHLQPAYARMGYSRGDFPVAEAYADTTVSLPIHPDLTDKHVDHIVESVNRFAGAMAPMEMQG